MYDYAICFVEEKTVYVEAEKLDNQLRSLRKEGKDFSIITLDKKRIPFEKVLDFFSKAFSKKKQKHKSLIHASG